MPRPHKPSSHEIRLERKIDALQIRLLQLNATLKLKIDYCRQLEWFVHRRNETIDTLRARLDQTTHRIRQLDIENTCLTTLIAASLDNDHRSQAHIISDQGNLAETSVGLGAQPAASLMRPNQA